MSEPERMTEPSAVGTVAGTVVSLASAVRERVGAYREEAALVTDEEQYDAAALRALVEAVRGLARAGVPGVPALPVASDSAHTRPHSSNTTGGASSHTLVAELASTVGELCARADAHLQALAAVCAALPLAAAESVEGSAPALARACVCAERVTAAARLLLPRRTLLTPAAFAELAAPQSRSSAILPIVSVTEGGNSGSGSSITNNSGTGSSTGGTGTTNTGSAVSQSSQQGVHSIPGSPYGGEGRRGRGRGGASLAHTLTTRCLQGTLDEFNHLFRAYEQDALVERSAQCSTCAGLVLADGYVAEVGSLSLRAPPRPILIADVEHFNQHYRREFFGNDHWNYVATDPKDGPVVLSIAVRGGNGASSTSGNVTLVALVRTKTGEQLQRVALDARKRPGSAADALRALRRADARHAALAYRHVGLGELELSLLDYEEKFQTTRYKFGVLYAQGDQGAVEDDMYANRDGCPLFSSFLSMLGTRIVLAGWDRFRGGLDVTGNATGHYSVFTDWRGFEVMFHVSTLLPYTPGAAQQVERKRHLGNDIVILVFHTGAGALDPSCFKSQFNHVFIVVRPTPGSTPENAHYTVTVIMRGEVKPFTPQFPRDYVFARDEFFREFILTKSLCFCFSFIAFQNMVISSHLFFLCLQTVIDGELAAMKTGLFSRMATESRKDTLSDIVNTFSASS